MGFPCTKIQISGQGEYHKYGDIVDYLRGSLHVGYNGMRISLGIWLQIRHNRGMRNLIIDGDYSTIAGGISPFDDVVVTLGNTSAYATNWFYAISVFSAKGLRREKRPSYACASPMEPKMLRLNTPIPSAGKFCRSGPLLLDREIPCGRLASGRGTVANEGVDKISGAASSSAIRKAKSGGSALIEKSGKNAADSWLKGDMFDSVSELREFPTHCRDFFAWKNRAG